MSKGDIAGIYPYPEPEAYASSATAYCLMFYDWEKSVGADWLEVAQSIFTLFGQTIFEGTGNLGNKHSHGRFNRVRKKLDSFLAAVRKGEPADFDIRVWSEHNFPTDPWFPCQLEMVWSVDASGRKKGMVAVRETLVGSLESLIRQVGGVLFDLSGPAYAHAFPFPTLFGPDSYLASVRSIPSGVAFSANQEYGARMTRWRDNRWNGFLASQGYFREAYPVNFVLDSHLAMPFQGAPLSDYMRKVGALKTSEYNDKMFPLGRAS